MSSAANQASTRPPVIFLMGPTASGKTATAMALAEWLPVELISVDSTLVYRGLDIGSAKPSSAELRRVPHHLIDIRDPAEPYSAADFRRDALGLIADIHARGRVPLLVGGTMLYFKVLMSGLAELPTANPALRTRLEAQAQQEGWPALHRQLAAVDPDTAAQLHPNHSQRILRALEVYHSTGQTMTALRGRQTDEARNRFAREYRLAQLVLVPHTRGFLHERIARRFYQMLNQGFEEEVRILYQRGDLSPALPAMRAVGYRQMWEHLSGQASREEMVARGIAATRQLAKRQLTWLRNWPDVHELYIDTIQGEEVPISKIRDQALNFIEKITI